MNIKKYTEKMKKEIAKFDEIQVDDLKVVVTTGNTKIGKVLNVSLPAVFTCPNCSGCVNECYDIRDCRYKNVVSARAKNFSIMARSLDKYFADIQDAINRHPSFDKFRFHVGGDIPITNGDEYFAGLVNLVRNNPRIRFWTYSKNYWVINRYVKEHGGTIADAIPDNLSIMFSQWRGIPMFNPYGFAEFRAYYDDEPVPDGIMECTGDCRVCLASGIGCPFRMTVWTRIRNQVKKSRK